MIFKTGGRWFCAAGAFDSRTLPAISGDWAVVSIATRFQPSDASAALQTLQPKFHLRVVAFFILAIVVLAYLGYTSRGVCRAYYGGLSLLSAVALLVQ